MNGEQFNFDIIHGITGCKCIKCFNLYFPYNDPFVEIIDSNTDRIITYELCLGCIKSFKIVLSLYSLLLLNE